MKALVRRLLGRPRRQPTTATAPTVPYDRRCPPRPRRPPYVPPHLDSPGPLVRPYLTAHEQRARRRELVLALMGQDGPGPYVIHGIEVA